MLKTKKKFIQPHHEFITESFQDRRGFNRL